MLTDVAQRNYAQAVDAADRRTGIKVVHDALSCGTDPLQVLTGLIAPIQDAVGQRWQEGQYTVAQEHAATAVADAAVAAVEAWIPNPTEPHGHVVVACPEREWHALAARILAESLRHLGWRTTFLGASTPARYLPGYLRRLRPDVMAVSCTVPAALPGARRIVEVAAAAGMPTIVGGRALGVDSSRATVLGASGWGASPQETADVLAETHPLDQPVPALPRPGAAERAEALLRDRQLPGLVRVAWDGTVSDTCLPDLDVEAEFAVDHVIQALAAATLLDDPSLLRDANEWLEALLTARGCRPDTVAPLWTALFRVLDHRCPPADVLLREGLGGS
ncbi:cobalamin B12-binding domain-containing protein [Cryptosporangium minutisporangium]|uniref:Cobalamin B12-binding domain-containing protein n=1 Tax=Cryptosporangium minutisporangium TaxID=113569 RepID=A0ABP6SYR7_9ACTN